ncbi:uncharacterized protein BDV17DRAFT_278576 [Aspergillus undulatus]|uniref:uncharacterized protein n=1 Tax=Aspergillus undulatus TaxID=1810928 RepID=UPI003CCD9BB2
MSSRRRNGQAASCEPCRKDKVRCDHGVPVCGRCQKRNIKNRCFYHPAPLTREGSSQTLRLKAQRAQRPAKERIRKGPQAPAPASPTPPSVEITIQSPRTDEFLPAAYFGPTSFMSAFSGAPRSTVSPMNDDSQSEHGHSVLPSYWVSETTKILSILAEGPTIEQLVKEYYDASQSSILPFPLILDFMAGMRNVIEMGDTQQILRRKTIQVLENTSRMFHIPSDTKGKDFHHLCTGPHLRLEIIGIMYAIAGRACFFGFAHDRFRSPAGAASRLKFVQKMLMACDAAIQVCKMLTPLSDLTSWLLYENWILSCMFHGEYSSPTWHRMGELASCVFELGLHRDCHKEEGVPTYLQEIRRRLFAGLYCSDKNIATFLGRPPRVSFRYSDRKPPLDISEEVLVADERELEAAMAELDSEGWNVHPVFQRSSWYRIRYIISVFREEILELSLRPVDAEAAEKLRDISFRCIKAHKSIPAHLRYSPENWNENHPIGIRVMLIGEQQLYLYNIFLIQRFLAQNDPSAETALLDVSSEILSSVLMLGRQQQHLVDIQRDFNSTAVMYGFSAASTLIKALQTQARTGNPLPYTGSRAELIRNLSVFVSHLEIMARPLKSNINHALFDRASKMFANILDEVLEACLPVSSRDTGAAEVQLGLGSSADVDLNSSWAADGMEFLDTLDFGAVFDQWVF